MESEKKGLPQSENFNQTEKTLIRVTTCKLELIEEERNQDLDKNLLDISDIYLVVVYVAGRVFTVKAMQKSIHLIQE